MSTPIQSEHVVVILEHTRTSPQQAQRISDELTRRIAQAAKSKDGFETMADYGRWVQTRAREVMRSFPLPADFRIHDVIVTFYGKPNYKGEVIMRVSCRPGGRIETF